MTNVAIQKIGNQKTIANVEDVLRNIWVEKKVASGEQTEIQELTKSLSSVKEIDLFLLSREGEEEWKEFGTCSKCGDKAEGMSCDSDQAFLCYLCLQDWNKVFHESGLEDHVSTHGTVTSPNHQVYCDIWKEIFYDFIHGKKNIPTWKELSEGGCTFVLS